MEWDGWHKAKDAYAYDFPLDKPHQQNLRKLIGLLVNLASASASRTKGKAFEQDCISVYHLEPYFCQQLELYTSKRGRISGRS